MSARRTRRLGNQAPTSIDPVSSKFDAELWAADIEGALSYIEGRRRKIRSSWKEERATIVRALNALDAAFGRHPGLAKLSIRSDLRLLAIALLDLSAGGKSPHPLLMNETGLDTAQSQSEADRWFKVNVVALVDILCAAKVGPTKAYGIVARELTAAGFVAPKSDPSDPSTWPFKPGTIKRWNMRIQSEHESRDYRLLIGLVQDIVNRNKPWPPSETVAIAMVRAVASSVQLANLKPNKRN